MGPAGAFGFERFTSVESDYFSRRLVQTFLLASAEFRNLAHKALWSCENAATSAPLSGFMVHAAIIGFFPQRGGTNLLLKWLLRPTGRVIAGSLRQEVVHLSSRPDSQLSEFLYKRTRFSG